MSDFKCGFFSRILPGQRHEVSNILMQNFFLCSGRSVFIEMQVSI